MYQGRPDHNAVISRDNFKQHGTYDAKERINSGLSVAGDMVYFDTLGRKVVALDIRTGAVRWQADVDNVTMSTPIVAGGSVYIGTGHNGALGAHDSNFVYAAGEHGSSVTMWGLRTARRAKTCRPPVAINGNLVFVNGDFNAYALRMHDGSAAWQHDLRGLATMASANQSGDYAIVSTCSGAEYRGATFALHWSTGAVRWRAAAGDCDSAPTVAANQIFVSGVDGNRLSYGYGAHGTVLSLDAGTGRVLWRYVSPEAGPYTKIGSNERAIAGCYASGTYFVHTEAAALGGHVRMPLHAGRQMQS